MKSWRNLPEIARLHDRVQVIRSRGQSLGEELSGLLERRRPVDEEFRRTAADAAQGATSSFALSAVSNELARIDDRVRQLRAEIALKPDEQNELHAIDQAADAIIARQAQEAGDALGPLYRKVDRLGPEFLELLREISTQTTFIAGEFSQGGHPTPGKELRGPRSYYPFDAAPPLGLASLLQAWLDQIREMRDSRDRKPEPARGQRHDALIVIMLSDRQITGAGKTTQLTKGKRFTLPGIVAEQLVSTGDAELVQ